MKTFKCCICKKESFDWGNNPYPIKDEGCCCNNCNFKKVIPERIKLMRIKKEGKKDDSKNKQ